MLFGLKKRNCSSHQTEEQTAKITKDDLVQIYNRHLARYIEQNVLEENEVAEVICRLCREKAPLAPGETPVSKAAKALSIIIV